MAALLVYSLILNFLRPANVSIDTNVTSLKLVHIDPFLSFYGRLNINNANLLGEQTNQSLGNFGFGKHALATTFIFPYLHQRIQKRTTPNKQKQGDNLIILICLLLSGDVHPCPGPLHIEPRNGNITSGTTRNVAVSQVRALCLDTVPVGVEQKTNLSLSGDLGRVLPERCIEADVVVSAAGPEASRTGEEGPRCVAGGISGEGPGASLDVSLEDGGAPVRTTEREISGVRDGSAEVADEQESLDLDLDDILSSNGLHVIHLNTRSLLPKISELRLLCSSGKVGILCCTESWLDSSVNDSQIEIENYIVIRNDRDRNGGGVCIYVRADIGFNRRTDLDHDKIEAVFVDILLPKSKPVIVGACYRPPNQNNFYEILEEMCSNCSDLINSEVIITGDFNSDILKKDSQNFKALDNFCRAFDFVQLIKEPTRVCETSETVIDLMLVSDQMRISKSGVVNYQVSDHCLIFCTRKISRNVFNCHNSIKIRPLKRYSKEIFIDNLSEADWATVLQCAEVDKAWGLFKTMFLESVNKLAPEKMVRIKQRTEPWINDDILNSIKERNASFRNFRKTKEEQHWIEFKKLRNKVSKLIDDAKKTFFNDKLMENKNNLSKMWKTLKLLGYSNRLNTKTSNISLKTDGKITSEKIEVANSLNDYFSTVAKNLVTKLSIKTDRFGVAHIQDHYAKKGVQTNAFSFKKVTEETVLKKLLELNPTKATGVDNMPARFLRDAAQVISPSITHIVNLSIESGKFPSELKLARVIPLYKKGSKQDHGNYRPVSILCVMSKIIEKIIYEQIDQYITSHNLLYEFQSGFRKSHSTDTCLLFLTDYIKKEIDRGNLCGMVMLDLQKAFDTVDHSILLRKLTAMGFNGMATNWASSYLRGREQRVEVGGVLSDLRTMDCGLPQGSVLGPLFFLLYINDMQSACSCDLLLYADDSALMVSNKNKAVIESRLSMELENVSQWLSENRLSLHIGKTESILFSTSRKQKNQEGFKVQLGSSVVTSTKSVVYLGCTLDNTLSGESMSKKVVVKVNHRIKFLARNSKYLDRKALRALAGALVQCHFDYACLSWYDSAPSNMKIRLQTAQNKLVRIVLQLPTRTHLDQPHFNSLGWLRVDKRVSMLKLCIVYKISKGEVPSYLNNYFQYVKNNHSHDTRGRDTNIVPFRFKLISYGQQTFLYSAAVLWNSLPSSIKQAPRLTSFKKSVRTWLSV